MDAPVATKAPATGLKTRLSQQPTIAALVLGLALILAFVMSGEDTSYGVLWLLGMGAGLTLQRSRFCFASAFRDVFLFGNARVMKGILVGLGVATLGFAIIMQDLVPFPEFGAQPPEAHVLPVGISTIVGGLMFGFGMVISGGCVSGSLYRMAEGYVGSWVSIAGTLVGLGLMAQTWNWWWLNVVSFEPKIWLPSLLNLGYSGAVVLTLVGLVAAFVGFAWWESRSGLVFATPATTDAAGSGLRGQMNAIWRPVFFKGWPAVVGGAVLGGLVVLMYMVHMPWGVTGELMRWSNASMASAGFAPPVLLGLSDIGGCAGRADEVGLFSHTFSVTVGLLPGALVGALLASEFKWRFPRRPIRYFQSFGGGILMGYGSGLAIGCTIGAFFSSVPSLSVSGWLFALALGGGAFLGVKAIKRLQ